MSTNLAPYALDPEQRKEDLKKSSIKFYEQPCSERDQSEYRTPYHRDRDRIIWSTAFRRLQNKTQVFGHDDDDHLRRRLTHSMEVAAIACSIARSLHLNEVATDAIALGHDIGHTPFGHAGEESLNRILSEYKMPEGQEEPIPLLGFDHCAHAIEVVSRIETHNGTTPGLNLSFDVRDGILKHIYTKKKEDSRSGKPYSTLESIVACKEYRQYGNNYGSLEAQCVWFADKLTYLFDDLEDAIRAKVFRFDIQRFASAHKKIKKSISKNVHGPNRDLDVQIKDALRLLQCDIMRNAGTSGFGAKLGEMFHQHYTVEDMGELYDKSEVIENNYPGNDVMQYLFWRNKTLSVMIKSCVDESEKRINDAKVKSIADVFNTDSRLIDVPDKLEKVWRGDNGFYKKVMQDILFKNKMVLTNKFNAGLKVRRLFEIYISNEGYELIPSNYKEITKKTYLFLPEVDIESNDFGKSSLLKVVTVRNYIAGMSDAYANQVFLEYGG